jgi:hypothetical protein
MTHYVLIDGCLQRSSPESKQWARRAAQGVPLDTEEKPDVLALPADRRTDFEIIQDLEETDV